MTQKDSYMHDVCQRAVQCHNSGLFTVNFALGGEASPLYVGLLCFPPDAKQYHESKYFITSRKDIQKKKTSSSTFALLHYLHCFTPEPWTLQPCCDHKQSACIKHSCMATTIIWTIWNLCLKSWNGNCVKISFVTIGYRRAADSVISPTVLLFVLLFGTAAMKWWSML